MRGMVGQLGEQGRGDWRTKEVWQRVCQSVVTDIRAFLKCCSLAETHENQQTAIAQKNKRMSPVQTLYFRSTSAMREGLFHRKRNSYLCGS